MTNDEVRLAMAAHPNMTNPLETGFKRRLRAAVHPRKKWVQSSEVAGNLCHAAKLLPKIVDPERRFGLLC